MSREKEREAVLRQYQQSTLGALMGGTTHELTNIAMGVEGIASSLEDRLHNGQPPLEEEVVELARAGQRLTRLAKRLRALSRVKRDLPERVDLRAALNEVIELLSALGRLKYIQLEQAFPPQPVEIQAPPQTLALAVVNLLANALSAVLEADEGDIRRLALEVRIDGASRAWLMVSSAACAFPPAVQMLSPGGLPDGMGGVVEQLLLEPEGIVLSNAASGDRSGLSMALPLASSLD